MTVEQKQRVVADRLEVSVVGTAFLLAMDRTLGGVQVQNDPLGVVERFRLPDQLSVQRHQPQQVLFARQHLRLEAVQRRGQGRTAIPDLLRTDQPKRRIDRNPLGVVEVLVASESAVDRLPQQIGQRELLVQALSRVAEMLVDQLPESESFIQFANENQTAIRGDSRSLEIDFEKSIERELKRLVFFFTHRVLTSMASLSGSSPYQ